MSAIRFSSTRLFMVAFASLLVGCPDDGNRPLGGECGGDGECASGLCSANLCLDPNGDDDLDGVINSIEASLGSNPLSRDSDGDGQVDGKEIASDLGGIDTDGDGKLDIIESRTRDVDGDCITDQFDAEDSVPNTDLSPMRVAVCKTQGICGEQLDALDVSCPAGVAVCGYDRVVGYAEPESACDGIDENCDGRIDGGFPPNCEFFDWDADGVKDSVDVCPETPDAAQLDSDGDGIGNACRDAYELAFEPAPPTALAAGASFDLGGVVRKKGEDTGAPLPRYKGRIDLVTAPLGGVSDATVAVDNAFTFDGLVITKAGTWRFQLQSSLGTTESADVVVTAGDAVTLALIAPAKVTAGESFEVSGVAYDQYDNVAAFDGAATLEANAAGAFIPPEGAFSDGSWTLANVALGTAGDTVLTLSAGGLSAQATVQVVSGPVGSVRVELPATVRAGDPTAVIVSVRDASGNVIQDFVGTVALSVDDPRADLPASVTFGAQSGGVRELSVIFGTLGVRTVAATLDGFSDDAATTVTVGAAHHIVLTDDGAATTGVAHAVTVSIVDVFGHPLDTPASAYTGTVTFSLAGSTPDLAPVLPGPTTFTAADLSERDVNTTWFRRGVWRLRATGTGLVVASATLDIDVALSPGMTLELDLPATAKAGVPVDVTVTVRDGQGNVATGFTGTVGLSDNDARSNLPALLPLGADHAGTRTIKVTFATPGAITVTARVGPLTDSAVTQVAPGSPYQIRLSAPGPAIAGQPQVVLLSIVDRFGNVANDPADPYTGTVSFDVAGTQPNPLPELPAPVVFTTTSQGVGTAEVTWFQAGAFTLRATGTELEVDRATASVRVVLATGLEVSLPGTVKSGVPTNVTVRALGLAGATATNFVGTVALRDNDSRSLLPTALEFTAADAGVRTFQATFFEAGTRTVTATSGNLSGSGSTIVLAGAPFAIRLSVVGKATTGEAKTVRVTIVDALGQVANDPDDPYTGTVSFDIAGAQPATAPTLPGPTTFTAGDNGVRDFQTTWFRVGTFTLRATGTGLTNGVATANVEVVGAPANTIELTLPATAKAGVDVPLTITVRDQSGNVATGFADTIRLSTNDNGSTVPSIITLGPDDAGTRTINVRFGRAGLRTVTATWQTVSASAQVTVIAGTPTGIVLTGDNAVEAGKGLPVRVVIVDDFGNIANDPASPYTGTVTFSYSGPQPAPAAYLPALPPALPAAYTFTAADAGSAFFTTAWFRPGRYALRVTGSGLTRNSTAALPIDVSVGDATRLEIDGPSSYVAGTSPSATVRATDDFRNVATYFDDNVTMGGSDQLYYDELEMYEGENTSYFAFTMTTAGEYVITADGGGLHGETTVTVLSGDAALINVTGPDEIPQDQNVTVAVRITDYYDNTVTSFEGDVAVSSGSPVTYNDPTPIDFAAADAGEKDFSLRFFQPGEATVMFSSSGLNDGYYAPYVLSSQGPSGLLVARNYQYASPRVGLPYDYDGGFNVALIDGSGYRTFTDGPVAVTVSLGEMAPGPALMTSASNTLTRNIVAGESNVDFDDLVFDRAGRYTLIGRPNIDISEGESDRFDVVYRNPDVDISAVTVTDGCVFVTYTVDQVEQVPVDISARYNIDNGSGHARQSSNASGTGHYQIPTSDGRTRTYVWNASYDLGTGFEGWVGVTLEADPSPMPYDSGERTQYEYISIPYGSICQPDVSALLPASAWPQQADVIDEADFFGLGPKTLAAGDFNSDGKLDLVMGHHNLTGVSISYGRGDGGFEPDTREVLANDRWTDRLFVQALDVDGDAKTDLAFGSQESGNIEVWRQGPVAFESFAELEAVGFTRGVASGDFDGDGFDDLAYPDEDGNITVAYSTGTEFETYTARGLDMGTQAFITDIVVMNADNHGGLDLAFHTQVQNDGSYQLVCVIRTGVDRTFDAPECTYVSSQFFTVNDLTPDPYQLDNRLFFRINDYSDTQIAALVFRDGQFDNVEYLYSACDFSQPDKFAVGNFERKADANDFWPDLATSCHYFDDYSSVDVFFMDDDENSTVRVDDIDIDNNVTMLAADFTGDGTDDIATRRGVLRTLPNSDRYTLSIRSAVRESIGDGDQNATLAADLDDDGLPSVIVLGSEYDFDGNITVAVEAVELYPYRQYQVARPVICTGRCPTPNQFSVEAAIGDINGDGLPDVVYASGAEGAGGRLGAVYDTGDGLGTLDLADLGTLMPVSIAVGAIFADNDGRDDVVVAGYNSDFIPVVVVVHWDAGSGTYHRYYATGTLPNVFREVFVGDFVDAHDGNEIVIIDPTSETFDALVFAPSNCAVDSDSCVSSIGSAHPLLGAGDFNYAMLDKVSSGDLDGDGTHELVTTFRLSYPNGTAHELRTTSLRAPSDENIIVSRMFQGYGLCKEGQSFLCVEAAGAVIGDLDLDGTDDIVVGWEHGRTWEAITAGSRYFFGGTVSERGEEALLTDIDFNGLLDVIVVQDNGSANFWLLGQNLEPPLNVAR